MTETLTSPGQHELQRMLEAQRQLTEFGVWDLRMRWAKQPPLKVLQFGAGEPEEQTIPGFPEEAFHGVAILNRTGKTVFVGFNSKAAIGAPLTVPPGMALVWPAEFANISLLAKAAGPLEQVVVLCLPYPPAQPSLLPFTGAKSSATSSQPEDLAVKAGASTTLLAANAARLGLEIVNNGAAAVRLMLGAAAEAKHGLWLSASGGTWNGMLGPTLWTGSVTATCDLGESTVAVVEA